MHRQGGKNGEKGCACTAKACHSVQYRKARVKRPGVGSSCAHMKGSHALKHVSGWRQPGAMGSCWAAAGQQVQLQARPSKGSSQGPEGQQPGARFSKGSSQAHLTGSLCPYIRPSQVHQAPPSPPQMTRFSRPMSAPYSKTCARGARGGSSGRGAGSSGRGAGSSRRELAAAGVSWQHKA